MKLSIVIIGDEILLGRVTDTNSGLIASTFAREGWPVAAIRTVGDKADDIRAAIEASLAESSLVVTTGGLGPTRDDITKGVMTDIFGGKLVFDRNVSENIDSIFADRKLKINELTRLQAMVPDSCRVIQNRLGTAPIMWFERSGKVLVAMPGVPYETRGMLHEVAKAVFTRFGAGGAVLHREFTVTGISESALAERLATFEDSLPDFVKLAYLPNPGEIVLRLDADYGTKADPGHFDSLCDGLCRAIGSELASADGRLTPAELLLHKLRLHGYTLATAESCTGGNIAHLITSVAGCSDVYRGGIVSYCNDIKASVLGVNRATLDSVGAVSEATVRQMAEGARRCCMADCAVATSGIAGPGGAVPGKPVGTVWIAASTPHGTVAACHHFGGDRQAVVERASAQAIMMLASLLGDTTASRQ
ncbi:MAG: CinA family nicotinamide mononucleotide deamidase-related protein [Muribaculaceae bacterium]|nr:CinA family nicotinamide mononucleotide deamidase-related protein [Muribaculaceae bacterium]